jgi:hypothetical protein
MNLNKQITKTELHLKNQKYNTKTKKFPLKAKTNYQNKIPSKKQNKIPFENRKQYMKIY